MHKPIQLQNINVSFPHKICFDDFSTQIPYGSRIAIIGRNGSGKSTLLNIIKKIKIPKLHIGFVPQTIETFESLSGGQRFNEALTAALSNAPSILLLDEPTNHLDIHNRKSLMRMLNTYRGTLIIASHDTELLRHCIDTLWHIDNGKINIFSGNYDDYINEIENRRSSIKKKLFQLKKQKMDIHESLMQEQNRAAKSRQKGEKNIEQRKWPTIVSKVKATRAGETTGRKKTEIRDRKKELSEQLFELRLPQIIEPKFYFTASESRKKNLISIINGNIEPVIKNINLSIMTSDRIAIMGNNGSGKSTLVKAILNDPKIIKSGTWNLPKIEEIGYLDQHYATLSADYSVLESIQQWVPHWDSTSIRHHLSDFLFQKNEAVNTRVSELSGGEKARLSLAQIAAKTPQLLILDEITNNLDLDMREHVIQILNEYPGTLIVISHDEDFLKRIEITNQILISNHTIRFF